MITRREFVKMAGLSLVAVTQLGGGVAAALRSQPLRVAVLPVVGRYGDQGETAGVVQRSLQDRFRTPLQSFVPIYDVVPAAELQAALPPGSVMPGKALRLDDAQWAGVAAAVKAEVVVAAEVTDYLHITWMSWDGDLLQRSAVAIRITVYDAVEAKRKVLQDADYYIGEYSPQHAPEELAKVMMGRLMDKLPVKKPDYTGL